MVYRSSITCRFECDDGNHGPFRFGVIFKPYHGVPEFKCYAVRAEFIVDWS